MKLHVFYRLSDKSENKERMNLISNKACLENFLNEFTTEQITIIADNVADKTLKWLETYKFKEIKKTNLGNSGSFWFAFNIALKLPSDHYVYLVENDYIHKPGSRITLEEGLGIADYVTLYDHPDKYADGLNPMVKKGGEKSKVFLTNSSHWKLTNSTTMTFASKVSTLKKDRFVFKIFTIGLVRKGIFFFKKLEARKFPADYRIFYVLTKFKFRRLISPIPGFSTHGEKKFLAPLVDWNKYINPAE
jgi:hypothetical protein